MSNLLLVAAVVGSVSTAGLTWIGCCAIARVAEARQARAWGWDPEEARDAS